MKTMKYLILAIFAFFVAQPTNAGILTFSNFFENDIHINSPFLASEPLLILKNAEFSADGFSQDHIQFDHSLGKLISADISLEYEYSFIVNAYLTVHTLLLDCSIIPKISPALISECRTYNKERKDLMLASLLQYQSGSTDNIKVSSKNQYEMNTFPYISGIPSIQPFLFCTPSSASVDNLVSSTFCADNYALTGTDVFSDSIQGVDYFDFQLEIKDAVYVKACSMLGVGSCKVEHSIYRRLDYSVSFNYEEWQDNEYDEWLISASNNATQVPEPNTIFIFSMALVTMAFTTRKYKTVCVSEANKKAHSN